MGSQDGQPLGSEVDAALGEIERGIDGLRGGASAGLPEESLGPCCAPASGSATGSMPR